MLPWYHAAIIRMTSFCTPPARKREFPEAAIRNDHMTSCWLQHWRLWLYLRCSTLWHRYPHVQIPSPGYFVNMHNCARYGLQPQCSYVNQRYLGFLVSLIPDHILSASTDTKLQILWKSCLLPVSSELFYKSSLHTRHAKNRQLLLSF